MKSTILKNISVVRFPLVSFKKYYSSLKDYLLLKIVLLSNQYIKISWVTVCALRLETSSSLPVTASRRQSSSTCRSWFSARCRTASITSSTSSCWLSLHPTRKTGTSSNRWPQCSVRYTTNWAMPAQQAACWGLAALAFLANGKRAMYSTGM